MAYEGIGIYGIEMLLETIPDISRFDEQDESFNKIDKFLAGKIEDISKERFEKKTFKFKYFLNMKNLKMR